MRFNFGATLYHLNNHFALPSTKVRKMVSGTPTGTGPRRALEFHIPKSNPTVNVTRPSNGFNFRRWGR